MLAKLICLIFGHKPLTNAGYQRGVGYARAWGDTTDGINCRHLFLKAKCPRCGEDYSICNVYVPSSKEKS